MNTPEILQTAIDLTSGDRAKTHGDKVQNHTNIARLWSSYLLNRSDPSAPLSHVDVLLMMVLLKVARTQAGSFNMDDFIDMAGYAAIAGEASETEHLRANQKPQLDGEGFEVDWPNFDHLARMR